MGISVRAAGRMLGRYNFSYFLNRQYMYIMKIILAAWLVGVSGVVAVDRPAVAMPAAVDEPKEILLWPGVAPGSEGKTGPEKVRIAEGGDHVISSIHKPSITPYLPGAAQGTGAAVIIAPGGGHTELWIDHEGYNPAKWLQAHGVAAFVLKYRLAREPGSTYTIDGEELSAAGPKNGGSIRRGSV
jgi:acetyl esterase/lipase